MTFVSAKNEPPSLADALRLDCANWKEIADGLDRALPLAILETNPLTREPADELGRYQEFVYFHDFAQKYLFGMAEKPDVCASQLKDWQSRPPGLQIFRRRHVAKVRIDLSSEKFLRDQFEKANEPQAVKIKSVRTLDLHVDRVNFYFTGAGVAMMVVEVSGNGENCVVESEPANLPPGGLMLDDLLDFGNRFRRVYAPYWDECLRPAIKENHMDVLRDGEGRPLHHFSPGRVPLAVQWLSDEGTELKGLSGAAPQGEGYDDLKSKAGFDRLEQAGRQPPMFDWWTCLLPAAMTGPQPQFMFRQIVDERMLTMTFVSAAKHADISDGDLMRLCFADSPGNPGELPQDARFLSKGRFERENTYMRFRHLGTRYFCCGYNFVALGGGGYFDKEVQQHFRRQYFQIGLVTHLQTAALLAFSQRISRAVSNAATPLPVR